MASLSGLDTVLPKDLCSRAVRLTRFASTRHSTGHDRVCEGGMMRITRSDGAHLIVVDFPLRVGVIFYPIAGLVLWQFVLHLRAASHDWWELLGNLLAAGICLT